MVKKLMELKLSYHVLFLFLLNAIAVGIYFSFGTTWDVFVLASVLVVFSFIYFAAWTIALLRARQARSNGFFIGAIVYWVMMLSVLGSTYSGLAQSDPNLAALSIVATGAFIGLVLFGGFISVAPLVVLGLIATIVFMVQTKKIVAAEAAAAKRAEANKSRNTMKPVKKRK